MNVRGAIERSFADVYDTPEDLFRENSQQCPLVRHVTRTRARREEQARRTRESARDLIARAAPIGPCVCRDCHVQVGHWYSRRRRRPHEFENEYFEAATTARDYVHRGGTVESLICGLDGGDVIVVDWPAPGSGPWARALATLGGRFEFRPIPLERGVDYGEDWHEY